MFYYEVMRCALECSIEGKLRLPQSMTTTWFGDKSLSITLDEEGFASTIRLEGPVKADDAISMRVTPHPGRGPDFSSSGGLIIRAELQRELQLIESTLGVFCRISRIRWESATFIVIPETPEEEFQVQWNHLRVTRQHQDTTRSLSFEDITSVLHMGHHARELMATMSFFREADSDMRRFRYITSFFSFYFVLEGLYANGQFKTKQVCAEFEKSVILRQAIERALSLPMYSQPAPFSYILTIDDFLQQANQKRNVEGVIRMLVLTRGNLHHFANNPNRLSGTPLTHQRYEILASFTHDVCLNVLMREITDRFPSSGYSSTAA